MTKEKFDEIIEKIGYQREKWYSFHEIESIFLTSGKGYYPNWRHLRFLISKDKIIIKHGDSEPYGARLTNLVYTSNDFTSMTFSLGSEGIPLEPSQFYPGGFRQPTTNDKIRVSEGVNKVYGESNIKKIMISMNSVVVMLWQPLKIPKTGRISFYDPSYLSKNRENCMHSTFHEGIYMYFNGNPSKKKFKDEPFHEEIKVRDIKEINLSIGNDYYKKTYKLE
jgi:hypothetical protein